MRITLLILMLLTSTIAMARDYYTEVEMKNFFNKRKVCNLAVGMLTPGPDFKSGEPNLGHLVMCVTDMKANVDTIDEVKGCGFGIYDVSDNSMSSPYGINDDPSKKHKSGFPMVEGKTCPELGFEKLLNLFSGAFYRQTVKEALLNGNIATQRVYLLSYTPGFDTWFRENLPKQPTKTTTANEGKVDCAASQTVSEEQSWECKKPADLLADICNGTYATWQSTLQMIAEGKKDPNSNLSVLKQQQKDAGDLEQKLAKIKAIYKRRTGKKMDLDKCQ